MSQEYRRMLRRYMWLLIPKGVAFLVTLGAAYLWWRGAVYGYDHGMALRPGGAYTAVCVALMFVIAMDRVEQIRQEIIDAINLKVAVNSVVQLGAALEALTMPKEAPTDPTGTSDQLAELVN